MFECGPLGRVYGIWYLGLLLQRWVNRVSLGGTSEFARPTHELGVDSPQKILVVVDRGTLRSFRLMNRPPVFRIGMAG
jgi:hypothetical protein